VIKGKSYGFVKNIIDEVIRIENLSNVHDLNNAFAKFVQDNCKHFNLDVGNYINVINLACNYKSAKQDYKEKVSLVEHIPYQALGLFGLEHCAGNPLEQDYKGKELEMKKETL